MGNQKWASDDDAGDLLAGILDETATEAEAEQQRIEAEIRSRQEEELRQRENEERQKRADAEARLNAEKERLEQVEQRRTQKLEALRIEDLKESGEWVPPQEEIEKKQPAHQAPPAAAAPPQPAAQPSPQAVQTQAAPQKSNTGLIAALLVLVVAIIGTAVVAFFVLPQGYEIDSATYAKANYEPAEPQTSVVELGFAPIPEVVEEEPAPRARTTPRRTTTRSAASASSSSSSSSSSSRSNSSRSSSAPSLDLDLNTDPFSGGF